MKFHNNGNRRVVVTGLGVISSIGLGWEEFWKNLLAGKSGISKISSFDTTNYDRHYAGEVKNFDPYKFIDRRKAKKIGRTSQMTLAATKLALKDANLKLEGIDKRRIAVCVGTTVGELRHLERYYDYKKIQEDPFHKEMIGAFPSNSLSSFVSTELGLKGCNIVIATACAAGNYAISYAYDLLMTGRADYVLAGGADSLSRVVFTGFARLYSIASEKCQPFDRSRQGMIPGEGAGIILLETLENAKKRDARIYAEVLGYGLSNDAKYMTIPTASGVVKAMNKSIKCSNIKVEEVNYICAHGTGTKENDKIECEAIATTFGKLTKNIPISSIKSMLGHTMGAAAVLEAIACCLAIKDNKLPPTINFNEFDPECNIDCVANKSRDCEVNIVLNNAQAFGGNNSCLVLKGVNDCEAR